MNAKNTRTVQTIKAHVSINVRNVGRSVEFYKKWSQSGLDIRDEMQTNCCYAIQDKTWVSDPDGNEWEVFVVLEDNLPEASGVGVSGCCAPAASLISITKG